MQTLYLVYNRRGGENGPVTVAAFKAADSALRGSNGGFDSHTPPPSICECHFDCWCSGRILQIP
jgi:hypothetical protein